MFQCSVFKVHLRRNQIHNLRFETQVSKLICVFVSPLQIKPAFAGLWFGSGSLFQETQWNTEQVSLFIASVNLLLEVVGQNGLEPSTSRLSVVCSSQLSYWPISRRNQIHNLRFEIFYFKTRLCLCFSSPNQTRFAGLCFGPTFWWRVPGSNRWPPACKAGALPAELTPHLGILNCLGTFSSVPSKLNNAKYI